MRWTGQPEQSELLRTHMGSPTLISIGIRQKTITSIIYIYFGIDITWKVGVKEGGMCSTLFSFY